MTEHLHDEVVRLDLPAVPRHVGTARAVAASLAAAAGWTIDDIDDIRLALDELLATLVESAGDGGRVRLAMQVDADGAIVAEATLDGSGVALVSLDELSRRIVDAIADEYEVGAGSFRLIKRPAAR